MFLELQHPIELPGSRAAITFSVEARRAFGPKPGAWRTVQQTAALALQSLAAASGATAVASFGESALPSGEVLLLLQITTDAPLTAAQLGAVDLPLLHGPVPWTSDGIHSLARRSFPGLAVRGEGLHQLWQEEDGERVAIELVGGARGVSRRRVRFEEAHPRAFLPGVQHALAREPDPSTPERRRLAQLEVAFSWAVARRIVEADGVVAEDERAFLARAYPADRLAELWLDDPNLLAGVARQAEAELKDLLGHHDKIALLGTFYATCHADGKLDVRELRVLREAAAMLGLTGEEVVRSLERMF